MCMYNVPQAGLNLTVYPRVVLYPVSRLCVLCAGGAGLCTQSGFIQR